MKRSLPNPPSNSRTPPHSQVHTNLHCLYVVPPSNSSPPLLGPPSSTKEPPSNSTHPHVWVTSLTSHFIFRTYIYVFLNLARYDWTRKNCDFFRIFLTLWKIQRIGGKKSRLSVLENVIEHAGAKKESVQESGKGSGDAEEEPTWRGRHFAVWIPIYLDVVF